MGEALEISYLSQRGTNWRKITAAESQPAGIRQKLAPVCVTYSDFRLKAPTGTQQQDCPGAAAIFQHGTCMMEKILFPPQDTHNCICKDGGAMEEFM